MFTRVLQKFHSQNSGVFQSGIVNIYLLSFRRLNSAVYRIVMLSYRALNMISLRLFFKILLFPRILVK